MCSLVFIFVPFAEAQAPGPSAKASSCEEVSARVLAPYRERVKNDKAAMKEYIHMRPWGVDLGIIDEAKKAVSRGLSTNILKISGGDADKITRESIVEAARKKDRIAMDIVSTAGANLGIRVAYLVNIFNPDIVVIGGGVEKAGDIFMDAVKSTVKKFSFEEPADIVKIIPSMLEDNAVVLGAAALAAREVFIET